MDKPLPTGRRPFQGVLNIIRFNPVFFVISAAASVSAAALGMAFPVPWKFILWAVGGIVVAQTLVSLAVSAWVYDFSGLYRLYWLPPDPALAQGSILHVHAGFDEFSDALKGRFADAPFLVFDFYDPALHTEASIARARAMYPPAPGTQRIRTDSIPLPDGYLSAAFVPFAAHEIRNRRERTEFFSELRRTLSPGGTIVLVEHIRDLPNFLAYSVGAFHFLPRSEWVATFRASGLAVVEERNITPFVTVFSLKKIPANP